MTDERHDQGARPADGRRRPYPLHKVLAAVERAQSEGVMVALEEAGFARDGIDVVTAEDVSDLDQPVGGAGALGFLRRLGLRSGGDLDGIEQAQRELSFGHSLILVPVDGDAERDQAHEILRQHGGHSMSYFGRWTITTLEGDAH